MLINFSLNSAWATKGKNVRRDIFCYNAACANNSICIHAFQLREHFEKRSAEYNFYKKEADRLARQIQQKRDSQKTIDRYLQNEQAAKRKKNQLE